MVIHTKSLYIAVKRSNVILLEIIAFNCNIYNTANVQIDKLRLLIYLYYQEQ